MPTKTDLIRMMERARDWPRECEGALINELADEVERLTVALRRIEAAEMPPTGWSAYVGQLKQIARTALEGRND